MRVYQVIEANQWFHLFISPCHPPLVCAHRCNYFGRIRFLQTVKQLDHSQADVLISCMLSFHDCVYRLIHAGGAV